VWTEESGWVGSAAVSDASYRAPKGTQDVLPPESARWQQVVAAFAVLVGWRVMRRQNDSEQR